MANPRIMRDLPRLLSGPGSAGRCGGGAVRHIGTGSFWAGAAESYGRCLRSRPASGGLVDDWRAFQARSATDNTFFAASNYYTYLTRRPD